MTSPAVRSFLIALSGHLSLALNSFPVERAWNEAVVARHWLATPHYVTVCCLSGHRAALLSLDVWRVVEVREEEEVGEREDDEAVAEELWVMRTFEGDFADGMRDDENKLRLKKTKTMGVTWSSS